MGVRSDVQGLHDTLRWTVRAIAVAVQSTTELPDPSMIAAAGCGDFPRFSGECESASYSHRNHEEPPRVSSPRHHVRGASSEIDWISDAGFT